MDAVQLAAVTLSRPRRIRPDNSFRNGVLAALATGAVIIVAMVQTAPVPEPETRIKGSGQALEFFEMRDGEPTRSDAAALGSAFRIRYDPGARQFTRILWREGNGKVVPLEPSEIGVARPTRKAGPRWMRLQFRLDDDPRPESAVAIFCDEDFDHHQAVEAARRGRDDCDVVRLRVSKR
jgi:hypothetical protein